MKVFKFIPVALVLLLSPLAARAEGKVAIGAQGGLTFPDFHVKDNATAAALYDNKNGWLGGLYLEFGVWSITLRPEVNYVEKGYTVAGLTEVKNRYIEVPVLVKINPIADAVISPFLVLGPQWSTQVSEKISPVGAGVSTSYTNNITNWDISAVAGLGLEVNISEHVGFNVQGRYSYGFRDVDASAIDMRNRTIYALVGLTFQGAF